jgi:dTDP-4-dehydrorhamnose reductase
LRVFFSDGGTMRLLLIGGNGQVGFELARSLAPLGELQITTRSGRLPDGSDCLQLDLDDAASVDECVGAVGADVVVNAGAYTAVDRAEDEPERAFRANADAVAAMAQTCARRGSTLLHYSTDYVFDGRSQRAWSESDPMAPLGIYGASKRAGELAIADSGCAHLVLRTAWVYAARGQNFMRTMLRLGAERSELSVVADQRGAPTPARWIAAATAALIARLDAASPPREILHLTAAGECSWYEFACAIFEDAHAAGLLAAAPTVRAIDSADYPTRARRPAFSTLDNSRLRERWDLALPEWRVGLRQVIAELASR